MTAYHRSPECKANISAAMLVWWHRRERTAELRWQHMAAMEASGWTHSQIARGFGMTRGRVTQLLAKHKARQKGTA